MEHWRVRDSSSDEPPQAISKTTYAQLCRKDHKYNRFSCEDNEPYQCKHGEACALNPAKSFRIAWDDYFKQH